MNPLRPIYAPRARWFNVLLRTQWFWLVIFTAGVLYLAWTLTPS